MIIWSPKDPGASQSYAFDLTPALGAATIAGTPVITGDGVTVTGTSVDGSLVRFTLSSGVAGTVAKVTGSAVTSGGETIPLLGVLPIGGEAVDLATAKAAQKIEDDDEDALLAGFLRAAIGTIEKQTGRNLTAKVVTQRANGFACRGGGIRLFRGPVSAILEVTYDDASGDAQTLSSFRLLEGDNARLLPAYNEYWPVAACGPGTVRISYVAGYDPAELPPELTLAAILLFGHFNANREAVVASERAAAVELPLGVAMLIDPYRSAGIA